MSESQPLNHLRVNFNQACQVVNLLCEGMSIRAAARLTGLHRDTVLAVLESAGQRCAEFLDERVIGVKAEFVQVDEIHTFVGCKAMRTTKHDQERGEFFTYLSVDRDSKLIINWHTSKRNTKNTEFFLNDLDRRMSSDGTYPRFHLTTDEYQGYCRGDAAVSRVFGWTIDYATEKKIFGRENLEISPWRNPLVVTGIKRQRRIGSADLTMATTCHAERTNLSLRTFTKRFARATICFSKKLENLRHAVAMFICHFNFVRKHSAHGKTPAMAAGLTDKQWSIHEIIGATI